MPLLLTLVFFVAIQFEKTITEPPQYSVIFTTNYYHRNTNNPYQFTVEDDQLIFNYNLADSNNNRSWQKPRLFLFDPVVNAIQEVDLPDINASTESIVAPVKSFSNKKLSKERLSPDGYVFEYNYRRDGNLLTALFGGGFDSRSKAVLRKGSYHYKLPRGNHYNSHFIAWVVGGKEEDENK